MGRGTPGMSLRSNNSCRCGSLYTLWRWATSNSPQRSCRSVYV